MIACQRLYRRRREISESNLTTTPEQSFQRELTRISLRKQGLEYKYRSEYTNLIKKKRYKVCKSRKKTEKSLSNFK